MFSWFCLKNPDKTFREICTSKLNLRRNSGRKINIPRIDAKCYAFFRRIFRWKRGEFLSFFGKRALTITNQFPPSENPTGAYFGFLTQNRFVLAGNSARLLKNTVGTKVNRNISLRRKIRRRIKKIFHSFRKTIFRIRNAFFIG